MLYNDNVGSGNNHSIRVPRLAPPGECETLSC